ncbi:uncharacterized protein V2V93DRAFT_365252 [Kockiozyma suomiensis]|uniref:uncharacterized protein n=1 Tax=Kockiozyma suomiensis TaxID=1337062 RepID=UPI003343139B
MAEDAAEQQQQQVQHFVSEPLLDEKAALQAAERIDLPMPDLPVDEISLGHAHSAQDLSTHLTSGTENQNQAQRQQEQERQGAYYADATPLPQPRRASTYAKNQAISLQRRLALANLPPITPVTTRSKERAAESAAVEASVNAEQTPSPLAADAGVPSVDIDLDTNTDYIALSSTLELLNSQRETASGDIVALQKLKNTALDDPDAFIDMLRKQGKVSGVPSMQNIVRAPIVRWNKYGITNDALEKEVEKGVVENDSRFSNVRVFNDLAARRKSAI